MTDTTPTTTGIRSISLVCLATPDQDRAVAFYEGLGFEKRTDTPFGGTYRWIEVYLPEGSTGIALAPPPPQGGDVTPIETGITLTTSDIDATHAAMKEQGVDVDAEVARMGDPIPPMFWFRDPTGHTLMVVEDPS
jgi:catechol 2,3-dioxygenase-like lactoylglutathione lyase family enzyme